jgi:hypothetical protein
MRSLQVRLGQVFQLFGIEAMFDRLAVRLTMSNDDGPSVYLDDFAIDIQILDVHAVATL